MSKFGFGGVEDFLDPVLIITHRSASLNQE